MRTRWVASFCVIAAGCTPETDLYLERVWDEGEAAVVVAVTEGGARTALMVGPSTAPRYAELQATSDLSFYARTFDELEGRDTSTCVTSFGPNDDLALGTPKRAWVGRRDGDAIRFTPESDPIDFDLRIRGCELPVGECDVQIELVDGGPTVNSLYTVAVPRDDFALLLGRERGVDDATTLAMRYESGTVTTLPAADDDLRGRVRALEFDGERMIAALGSDLFVLDERAVITASVSVGFEVRAMEAGSDGVLFMISDAGELAFVAPGTLDVVPFEGPRYGEVRAEQPPDLDVVDATELVIFAPDGTLWRFAEGMWVQLLDVVEAKAIATDGRFVVVARDNAPVILHRLGQPGWDAVTQAFTMQNAIHAEALPDGRFLIAGQTGTVAYFDGREVCTVPSATDRNIEDFDLAPSGDFAFAVGENYVDPERPTLIMRWTIPRRD